MYDRRARASSTPPALLQCAPSRQGKRAPCQDSGPGRRRLHGRRRDGLDWRREFGGGRPRVGSSSGATRAPVVRSVVSCVVCGVRSWRSQRRRSPLFGAPRIYQARASSLESASLLAPLP
ncbi:unnamed protein product [Prorocentrum cordatum]|uniref:Uncharacterized protein n=1 Tax=Prorocentrum cordatum TaxID=2364126 RepID=A0ABN9RNS9_9DINO|nr:unnamed protein product [Polarella glacialis]